MRNSKEGCILSEQQETLKKEVASLQERMNKLEGSFKDMRVETQNGFKENAAVMQDINVAINNLAHDFGERMTNLDKRMIMEKEKWGDTLRTIVVWSVKVLLLGALAAEGVTMWKNIFG
jgi:hypothetical protein